MPKDITASLKAAKSLIQTAVCSHQSTPEMAAIYACRQLNLPKDVKASLVQYAIELSHANRRAS